MSGGEERPTRLRVGFAVSSPVRAWVARAVALAAARERVETVHVLALPPLRRRGPRHGAFAAYAGLDELLFGRGAGRALAPAALEPDAKVTLAALGPDEAGPEPLAARLRALELDVLVDLTGRSLEAPDAATEVWRLRHGAADCASPYALAAEFAAGARTCGSRLVRRDGAGETTLYASTSLLRRLSLCRSRDPVYWKGAAFAARALERPAAPAGVGHETEAEPPADAEAVAGPPSPGQVARMALRLATRAAGLLGERALLVPGWSIAWRLGSSRSESAREFVPCGRLDPPADRFYADPFLVPDGGRHYLFYEAYRRAERRAEIEVVELRGAVAGEPRPALVRPYHLSYPFVFRDGGAVYMVPESAQARLVQLFRATRFPFDWELHAVLLSDVELYDATLVRHDGLYFLFGAIPEPGADIDELHLFSSRTLEGPYSPHPCNPVVSDVRRARPAGRIFRRNGLMIRPAQDGSNGYGSAVVLSEIVRLTAGEYRERPLGRIDPSWSAGGVGTHTVDHDGTIEVMDMKYARRRFAAASPGRSAEGSRRR